MLLERRPAYDFAVSFASAAAHEVHWGAYVAVFRRSQRFDPLRFDL
jgi:hypothetical protein